MLVEITPDFWIDLDKIFFIIKQKDTEEWHLHLSADLRQPHLILTDADMATLRRVLLHQAALPFSPGTCL